MNIGVDLRCLLTPYKTGVGVFASELLSAIFKIDQINQYFLFSNSYSKEIDLTFDYQNVKYLETKFPNKMFSAAQIAGFPKLDKYITKKFNLPKLDYFFSPHLNFTATSKETKDLILIHDLTFKFFPYFFTNKQKIWHHLVTPKKQCTKAYKIFVPSENTRRDLLQNYSINEEKITVLHPGLSPVFKVKEKKIEEVKRKYNLPEKYLLFFGTIEPRKNISALIKAFENLPDNLNSLHLVLAGASGWKNNDIKQLVEQSRKKDRIHFLNYIEEKDKPAIYELSTMFVYPSIYEGFGFPILEAFASEVPVITSNRSSLVEITKDAAYLINPSNPEEIIKGIETLSNINLRNDFIRKGLLISEKYTWENTAKEWLQSISK